MRRRYFEKETWSEEQVQKRGEGGQESDTDTQQTRVRLEPAQRSALHYSGRQRQDETA